MLASSPKVIRNYYAIPAGKTATQDSEIGSWKAERIRAVFVIGMDTLVQDFVN